MREYKYKSTFAAAVKCIVSEEKDLMLSKASLDELKKSIPTLPSDNDAFLPVAFPAFVANRINKNDDVIDTKTALAIYQHFIHNPTNIEHKRHNVVGVIISAGFTEFGSDRPLTYEQVKNLQTPFCVTLGAIVWKIINPEFAELLEESNDPTSDDFMGISASWELGFQDYNIVELDKNQKNIIGGRVISDATEVEKLSKMLRINGGTGVIEEKRIYRMPTADVFPLGIGFTQKPAADVKGVAVNPIKEEHVHTNAAEHFIEKCSCGNTIGQCRCSSPDKAIKVTENGCPDCREKAATATLSGTPAYDFYFCPNCQKETPKGSKSLVVNPYGHIECPDCHTTSPTTQWSNKPSKTNPKLKDDNKKDGNISPNNIIKDVSEKQIVKADENNSYLISQVQKQNVIIERNQYIMIKSINDLTDENLKVATASSIAELVSSEIKKGNDTWLAEKNQFVTQRQESEAKLNAAVIKQVETEKTLATLQSTVANLQKEKVEREAVEKFNSRMSEVMAQYTFDEEQSSEIAAEIRELKSDEDFAKWETKAKKLFKPFQKKNDKDGDKDGDKDDDSKDGKKDNSKAGEANPLGKEAKASVVDTAIDNAKKDTTVPPNTQTAQTPTLKERFASAFAMEQFVISK